MSCYRIEYTDHFLNRYYRKRKLYEIIPLEILSQRLLDNIKSGYIIVNSKHVGKEGPRYHTCIDYKNIKVIVIFEKASCYYKIVTAWKS